MKKSLLTLLFAFTAIFVIAQTGNPLLEVSPNPANPTSITKAAWNVQFNYSTPLAASGGCETDGTNFYVAQWNSSLIWKLSSAGVVVDSFAIPGVTGLRDLAYDGTYFYGGANNGFVYQMDFTLKSLVSTITMPSGVTVRHICYDPHADSGAGGFWVGNWATDFVLVSRTGATLQTILAATHKQTSLYGSAYDTLSPDGPYIWVINANNTEALTVTQIDATTGVPTGYVHGLAPAVASAGSIGGGLFIQENLISGTTTLGGMVQGVSLFGYDLSSTVPDTFDLALNAFPIAAMVPQGQNVNLAAMISNQGYETITSFDINYQVDANTIVTQNVIGVSIPMFGVHNMILTTPWSPVAGSHIVSAWLSNPNGHVDETANNDSIINSSICYGPTAIVQRLPLHESFTSSTCGPCVAGNENMATIFNANPNKWVVIKYQMNWPSPGDPYYTAEGGVRRDYYGVSSVPALKIDGGHSYDGNSSSYSTTDLNSAYGALAFVEISAALSLSWDNSVDLVVDIDPNIDLPAGTVLHSAIVEWKTQQNTGSNGETEFDWVMKKMLPNASGTTLSSIASGATHTEHLNHTFEGNFRKPNSAADPINHATEHSVEKYWELIGVVWLQDPATGVVYNAAYSSVAVGLDKNDVDALSLNVYPNPANDMLNIEFVNAESQELSINVVNNLGQTVYTKREVLSQGSQSIKMNTQELPEGIYFVNIQTAKGSYTKPIVVKH